MINLSDLSAELRRREAREKERRRRERNPELYREKERRKEARRRERARQVRENRLETLRVPCVNCDSVFKPTTSMLYCSELCEQEAHYVRYARRTCQDGRAEQPDVRDALTIQRAHVLSGGYPARERRLSPKLRAAIFERDSRRCRFCGAVATEIDHIGGPIDGVINHPDNLQALCHDCHTRKSLSATVPVPPDEQGALAKARALDARIEAPLPVRPSDDEENWAKAWREIVAERRAMMS